MHLTILWAQTWIALCIVIDILINGTPQSWIDTRRRATIERIPSNIYRYLRQLSTFRGYSSVIIQMLVLFVTMTSLVIIVRQGAGERNDVLLWADLVVLTPRLWLLMTHGTCAAGLYLRYQSVKHIIIYLFNSEGHFICFAIWVLAYGAVVVGCG